MNDIKLKPMTFEYLNIDKSFEVFHEGRWIGDIAVFDSDSCWRYRTPNNMMWWKETDQDSAIAELLRIKGNSILQ